MFSREMIEHNKALDREWLEDLLEKTRNEQADKVVVATPRWKDVPLLYPPPGSVAAIGNLNTGKTKG